MSVVEVAPQKPVPLRRSQRVVLAMPIVVSGEIRGRTPFSQETRTMVVNAHGALLLLRIAVRVGQLLTLKNLKTQEQQSCRVVNIAINQDGKMEAAVEFLTPAPRFWRIAFPPLDWTPKSEEARRATRPATTTSYK
jgi:hypothetical protein